jgi:hypothetical protein
MERPEDRAMLLFRAPVSMESLTAVEVRENRLTF